MAELTPTPNDCPLPRRRSDFATFNEAIDYAARSEKGLNFYDPRATLERAYPFRELREDALGYARRLVAMGIAKDDRVALIAETSPEFTAMFCACVYAGAWPVPLPLPTTFGGKDSYIEQLGVQLASSDPKLLLYPGEIGEMAAQAAAKQGCKGMDWVEFAALEAPDIDLPEAEPDDICYLQYSSGSTRFPTGVAVTHKALLHNLYGHSTSMNIGEGDRGVSWLPLYHDMGLVGCFLSMIGNQVSADYLKTEHFARRPLAWLELISRNQGQSMSYSPTFGYDICARRISSQSHVADRFDLSRWRLAGNGADMIRPDVMQQFVNAFADAGFKASAFTPSYGLAEATLAVTVMPPGEGIRVELVEEERLSGSPRNLSRPARYRAIVNCGKPLPDMDVEIRGETGDVRGDHQIGKVWCRGPSVMHSYFRDEAATRIASSQVKTARGLARHRRHGLSGRRLSVHRRPGERHDYHQRQEPLAAGYRMGGGTTARFQPRRYRRLRHRDRERRGIRRRAGALPRLRSGRTHPPARSDRRQGPRRHRHGLRGRTRPPAHPAAHLVGQAEPGQGTQDVSFGRNHAARTGCIVTVFLRVGML